MSAREPGVLLISPGIIKWTDMDFGLPHLVALGGYLREHTGARVELLDLNYEGGDHVQLARTIESLGPHLLIGVSCYSSFDYLRVLTLARFLREQHPDTPIVAGGYHASACPEDLIFPGSPIDAVIRGEGERPMRRIVETLLGGARLEQRVFDHDLEPDINDLPPYAWDLLDRYWPRATDIGRKLQLYLSRGCPYRCVFCMERAKTDYNWRAYTPERALEELRRLARYTDLSHWVINIGDPLFGFHRAWRREVLEGILREDLLPRQYWTLTRSDDLDVEDVKLLAAARFSIGIGLESGSPRMLRTMRKGNTPERYLGAIQRLARLSREHGLNWAANIIVGHPGETPETMRETHAFLTELYTSAAETCGWLSIDPFRLYPGSFIQENLASVEAAHGAKVHHPRWWTSWYDGPFRAEHVDPSATLDFEGRVRFMYDAYPPLIEEVQRRFKGQGRSVDRVFRRSLEEQKKLLSPSMRDSLLAKGRQALKRAGQVAETPILTTPLGLRIGDPWVRRREAAVRRLLDEGVLRTNDLIEALLRTPPEAYMPSAAAEGMLRDHPPTPSVEGEPPLTLGVRAIAMGLEALEPALGDRVADLGARSGYVAALLGQLVGPRGEIVALKPRPDGHFSVEGLFDGLWLGAALPRFPRRLIAHLQPEGGRAVTLLGPRFRAQDLVALTRDGEALRERYVARVKAPVWGGPEGWLPAPRPAASEPVAFGWREAPALAYRVLSHLDLGADAANVFDPGLPEAPWVGPLRAAYAEAPGRLALQFVGLGHDRADALLSALTADPPAELADPAGQRLLSLFREALQRALPDLPQGSDSGEALQTALAIGPALQRLRETLWASSGRPPPPLTVLHVPALGRHGRAAWRDGQRVVAVDLGQPAEHALLQILHEEMHPVTDPLVLQGREGRDTRAGSAGFALHQELEAVAVGATQAVLEAHAPEHVEAFHRWKRRSQRAAAPA